MEVAALVDDSVIEIETGTAIEMDVEAVAGTILVSGSESAGREEPGSVTQGRDTDAHLSDSQSSCRFAILTGYLRFRSRSRDRMAARRNASSPETRRPYNRSRSRSPANQR